LLQPFPAIGDLDGGAAQLSRPTGGWGYGAFIVVYRARCTRRVLAPLREGGSRQRLPRVPPLRGVVAHGFLEELRFPLRQRRTKQDGRRRPTSPDSPWIHPDLARRDLLGLRRPDLRGASRPAAEHGEAHSSGRINPGLDQQHHQMRTLPCLAAVTALCFEGTVWPACRSQSFSLSLASAAVGGGREGNQPYQRLMRAASRATSLKVLYGENLATFDDALILSYSASPMPDSRKILLPG